MTSTTDATELAAMIKRKEISPLEAVDAAIARAEAMQPELNFMVTPVFERARERARSGDLTGPFAGVPYLLKDMYEFEGVVTRWGTRATALVPPAAAHSSQVKAFEAAGLVIIGTSALGEFGFLPTTEPVAFGPTRNPWDLGRTPGGSSGGSAAAVAAGVVPMADGADGGGSIRIPASACGLFGLKPSRRRLIGEQPVGAGVELTVQHCISRSVRDSAALFAAMELQGADAVLAPVGHVEGPSDRRLRVGLVNAGVSGPAPHAEVTAATTAAADLLEQLGHQVVETVYPLDGDAFFGDFLTVWLTGASEVVDLIRMVLGAEPDTSMLEPFTLAMATACAALPPGALDQAKAGLSVATRAYDAWFDTYDVILSPVLLQPPVPIGEITGEVPIDTLTERLAAFASCTPLHNATGAPAMSVPLHWTADGLPVGVQFAARLGDERTLYELAFELEAAQPWAHRRPPVFAE